MSISSPLQSHERAYLLELMQDFPAQESVTVEMALNLLSIRYNSLDISPIAQRVPHLAGESYSRFFNRLPKQLHAYLYKDILGNAGVYRQVIEKNSGVVFFGNNQKFHGLAPTEISDGIIKSFSNFSQNDPQPIHTVVSFYQQFVYVHPFYDANGRISRFITSIYLDSHGYFISWEQLHKNSKWLKKLNACHVRYNSNLYGAYLLRLVEHWSKFIVKKSDIFPS